MRFFSTLITLLALSGLLLTGCAAPLTGDVYSRNEARVSQTVSQGVITDIRMVTVEGTDSGVGKIGGAVVGGVVGSRIDGGSSAWSVLGGAVGALGAGLLGTQVEERITRIQAYEMTIKENNGRVRAIVQEVGKNESFQVGDRVNIITNTRGASRVTH